MWFTFSGCPNEDCQLRNNVNYIGITATTLSCEARAASTTLSCEARASSTTLSCEARAAFTTLSYEARAATTTLSCEARAAATIASEGNCSFFAAFAAAVRQILSLRDNRCLCMTSASAVRQLLFLPPRCCSEANCTFIRPPLLLYDNYICCKETLVRGSPLMQ